MQPELLDIVEVLIDLPAYALQAGTRGTVVHHYPDNAFEVEFMNEDGETTALCPILATQCIVVWKASTKKWLPAEEQSSRFDLSSPRRCQARGVGLCPLSLCPKAPKM